MTLRAHLLAVTSVAALLAVACGSDPADTPASDQTPAGLFAQKCATCHGPGGTGVGNVASIVGVVDRDGPDAVTAVITDGRAGMPAFGAQLDDAEIAAIVEYLATFD